MDVLVESHIRHFVIVKDVESTDEAECIAEAYTPDLWEVSDENQITYITESFPVDEYGEQIEPVKDMDKSTPLEVDDRGYFRIMSDIDKEQILSIAENATKEIHSNIYASMTTNALGWSISLTQKEDKRFLEILGDYPDLHPDSRRK